VVCKGIGLHPDKAWSQRGEERDDFASAQLAFRDDLSVGADSMYLKNPLGEIETNNGNILMHGNAR
jgi:hypothetical protein